MVKRLIEEWLPMAELGIESVRERTPMTPFLAPNRLHVWWARRPLVASREAVLDRCCRLMLTAQHSCTCWGSTGIRWRRRSASPRQRVSGSVSGLTLMDTAMRSAIHQGRRSCHGCRSKGRGLASLNPRCWTLLQAVAQIPSRHCVWLAPLTPTTSTLWRTSLRKPPSSDRRSSALPWWMR